MSIPLYWQVSNNFGDALAPWLVKHISGKDAVFADPSKPGPVPFLVTGSIFKSCVRRGVVWGSGCAYENDLDEVSPPSEDFRVIATRGLLTKAFVENKNHSVVTTGDPGLLLSRFYTPKRRPKSSLGIICSWVDYDEVKEKCSGVPILNAQEPIEQVIDAINSWDIVVSGCLHGLVAAIAYNKPFVWARFSEKLLGGTFKFRDFFSGIGVNDIEPVRSFEFSDFETGVQTCDVGDLDDLYTSCPFRNS